MSGVTSTIYFSIHGFKTLHSKGCSTFHRFLNDHRLQKTLLMEEFQGDKLQVLLSYDCFRSLSPAGGIVGAYRSSRHIIAFCADYAVSIMCLLSQCFFTLVGVWYPFTDGLGVFVLFNTLSWVFF